MGNVVLSSLIRVVYNLLREEIAIEEIFVGRIHLFVYPGYKLLINNSDYLYRIELSKFVKM